jgi:hypothetical protein
MPRTARHSLWRIALEPSTYTPDVSVLDRYVAFSAELVRLALAGIGAYAFLLTQATARDGRASTMLVVLSRHRELVAVGICFLAVGAACAVGHRYFATDALTHVLRLQRSVKADGASENLSFLHEEERSLQSDLRICALLLIGASAGVAIGFVTTAAVFAFAFGWPFGAT